MIQYYEYKKDEAEPSTPSKNWDSYYFFYHVLLNDCIAYKFSYK
jgi:hypothetical protein